MPNGHFLVTEINGDWVDEIDAAGHVYWTTNPPGVNYPSDSNQVGPDRYLTVDYSYPGQTVVFNQAGQTLWRYDPTGGPGELNHPSLAMGLPNGDILLNDDYNDRVIVVDPGTNKIVWQYGHDGPPGRGRLPEQPRRPRPAAPVLLRRPVPSHRQAWMPKCREVRPCFV